ncbi:MAG: hypothetical protein QG629_419 [Patescibacteria group bacterium]|nr:DEAD/DEAH box helicase [Candidatus Saccharibacteria bacterium]MDQ5963337.1 hypothetical protein [Patescibacteria group bacterium]
MPNSNSRYAYRGSRRPYARANNANRSKRKNSGRGQYINPELFVRVATSTTVEEYTPTHTFADFALDERLQKTIARKGYVVPTPIQDQAIPLGLQGLDVIGIANTGTGKTAAFALPVLSQILTNRRTRALIVAPTRELAAQIEAECHSISPENGIKRALLIGGSPYGKQLFQLRQNPSIVIGTPGRIKDHIERGTLRLSEFNIAVLDEVDRMLDMGFVDDVRLLLTKLSNERQIFYFSATMDARVSGLIATFSPDARTVTVKSGDTSDTVHQDVVRFQDKYDKQDKLHDILIHADTEKVIIFEETQRNVERLEIELKERGFEAISIHGGKSQGARSRALRSFKNNEVKILVATDVAARGIDVSDITHVVNYAQPQTYEDYVHRIGRTGRAGRIGHALTFIQKH